MKRILYLLIILCFCVAGCDIYYNKQPDKYGEWQCDKPLINYSEGRASAIIEDEEMLFELRFSGNVVHAIKLYEAESTAPVTYFFVGTCEYGKEKFVIKIDAESDVLFNGKYDELVFYRRQGDGSPVS